MATNASASDSATSSATATDVAADEYRNAAAGLRTTARTISGAFAALPGLAIVAALIKGPGSGGWEAELLVPGIILAAAGAVIGIYVFADVQRPGELTDRAVTAEEMAKLPEAHGFETVDALRRSLEDARADSSRQTMATLDAKGRAEALAAELAAAEAVLKALVDSASDNVASPDLPDQVHRARLRLIELASDSGEASADAAIAEREAEAAALPFAGFDSLRRAAYGLALADIIRGRFDRALKAGAVAVLVVAIGIALVALAPKEKKTPSAKNAPAPSLLYLTLSRPGITKLGCTTAAKPGKTTVPAIKVSGGATTPHVITFATAVCPLPKELDFKSGATYGISQAAVKQKAGK